MRHVGVKIVSAITGLIIMAVIVRSPWLTAYVEEAKQPPIQPAFGTSSALEQPPNAQKLKRRVKEAAKKHSQPARDARIDSVWRAIPGYNGLIVDEQRTLQLALKRGARKPLQLVYEEIPPRVQLHDLPPHPIYRGNEYKPMVGLMINVAWGTEHLEPMLHILEQENVRATFFLDGSWLAAHPNEGRRLVEKGHEIGNHAYHHPQMSRLTAQKARQEIEETERLIADTLGVESTYFAPPSGDFNDNVIRVAAELGLHTVLWTADTIDWRPTSSPQMMVQRVSKQLGNGTLILMHPTDRTVEALPEIIRVIKDQELKPGTVADVLSPERIPPIEPILPF